MVDALLIKNDLYYTNPSAVQMGFMLAKEKRGTKLWRRDDERALPDSFAPGDISYANLSPDIQKVIAHRYMHGGLGALEFEVEDDELYQILRYLRSENLDLRCKGKAYPGPKIVSLTFDEHTASAYNQATNYYDADSAWADEANIIDSNPATFATESVVAPSNWSSYIELHIPAISCSKVNFKWDGEVANVNKIDVDLYYDGAWNDLYEGVDGDGAEVEKAIGSTKTVTKARARIYNADASNREAYLYILEFYAESATVLGTPKCFCVFNDKQYFAKGNTLLKLKDDFSGYEVVRAFAADITSLVSFSDDNLYIALGAANIYWYMDDATPSVFVESGLGAPNKFDKFCKVGTDLWGLILPNKIHKSSNPTDTGAWGAEITVGEAAYNVNDMWEHDGYLYCQKEEGAFYENGAGVIVQPFPELASIAHVDSGKNSAVFRGGLYFRMGNQQEWEIKGGVLTEITPEIFASPSIYIPEIEVLRPNAAGDECTISGESDCSACPNHYQCVDEEVADEFSTYVYNGEAAFQRDLYNIVDHSIGLGTITKITVYARCQSNNVPEQTTAKIAIKSGTGAGAPDTVTESPEKTTTTRWVNYSNEWATNPATSGAWTWAEIDKLQIGVSLREPIVGTGITRCTQVWVDVEFTHTKHYAYPCVARAHDESWLYAIIKRGATELAVLAGRWEYIAGRSRWIWHEIRSIDLTDVATAFVCSVEGRPYLYLGSTLATENVYKLYLPITNDATADSGYKFYTAGSLWTPRYMTLLFSVTKRWQELFLRSFNLYGAKYINVYYSTNDGASFTLLKKFDTSPEQTEAFTNIETTMMNLRFDFVGDSETVPPVMKYFNLKAMTMMPPVARFRHTVKCADNLLLKKNVQSNTTVAAIAAYINGIRDKVCTLGDVDGVEHTVMVKVVKDYEAIDFETNRPIRLYDIEAIKL